jgi:hypothetical protein
MPTLSKHWLPFVASALVLLSPSTQGATWFEVQEAGNTSGVKVEVDLESLRSRGDRRELVTRISYAQPRQKQDISFQSVVAGLEIFCDSGLAIWKTANFFTDSHAEGNLLSSENFGPAGLSSSLLNLLPDKIWNTLQRSACGRAETTSP